MITLDKKPYYQPDEYYMFVTHKGTPFEYRVVTLDQRRKETYPSKQGLYVPEILLLDAVIMVHTQSHQMDILVFGGFSMEYQRCRRRTEITGAPWIYRMGFESICTRQIKEPGTEENLGQRKPIFYWKKGRTGGKDKSYDP
jgi:hypothetical protein